MLGREGEGKGKRKGKEKGRGKKGRGRGRWKEGREGREGLTLIPSLKLNNSKVCRNSISNILAYFKKNVKTYLFRNAYYELL
jgi:hypothetical protein